MPCQPAPASSSASASSNGFSLADAEPLVAILLHEQMLASSATLPLEMLNAAGEIARRENRHRKILGIVSASVSATKTSHSAGLNWHSEKHYADITRCDMVIIPTFWRSPLKRLHEQRELLGWLRKLHSQGTQLYAVSTGSFLLAEAGLLDHKPATTHWFYLDIFERRYPQVNTQRRHLITAADGLYCAGSINAVADLMVRFVADIYGPRVSEQMALQFSPEIRTVSNSSRRHLYIEGEAPAHHDEDIARAQQYLQQQAATNVNLAQLAQTLGLSQRSFNRRFKTIVGQTPKAYLQQQRMVNARDLLANSNLLVAEVAALCGYQDASYFVELFKRSTTITPARYRQSVRGKLFDVSV